MKDDFLNSAGFEAFGNYPAWVSVLGILVSAHILGGLSFSVVEVYRSEVRGLGCTDAK